MNKLHISDESFLEKVKYWIETDGVIYLDIYFVHAGSTPAHILLFSYEDFIDCLPKGGMGEITIVRYLTGMFTGIANAELLAKAIKALPDGKEWWLTCRNQDDVFQPYRVSGKTHQELMKAFEYFNNKYIAVSNFDGDTPPNRPPTGNEEILVAEFE